MEISKNSKVTKNVAKEVSTENPQKESNRVQEEEEVVIPDEWSEHNFQELYEAGWKPRVKKSKGRPYISLYKGNKNRGLGLYDEERWDLISRLFPKKIKISNELPDSKVYKVPKHPLSIMSTTMKRADWAPKTFIPTVDTLKWFETLKLTGSPVGFDEFINDIVETHFTQCHGLKFRIVMTEPQR